MGDVLEAAAPQRPLLAELGVAYLALFTLDGTLSLADAALQELAGSGALRAVQAIVAGIALGGAPCALLCCALSPRWPAYVYLPPIAATLWFAAGGAPVPLAVGTERAYAVLSAVQVAVAALAWTLLALLVSRSGGLGAFSEGRREASGRRFAAFAVASITVCPFLVAGYVALATVGWLEAATDGFLDLRSDGVAIAERRYVRGQQEVRLVGMMHVGQPESYAALFDSFRGESTLVLEEGVSDRQRLLKEGLSYGKAARALGLGTQGSVSAYFEEARDVPGEDGEEGDGAWPDVTIADVDVADFSPSTIAFIDRAGAIWASDEPLARLIETMRNPPPTEELNRLFAEIVDMRNRRVLEELERGLRTYRRVIVPWGALHLPGIARAIEQDGFVRAGETKRLLLSWSTVFAALSR